MQKYTEANANPKTAANGSTDIPPLVGDKTVKRSIKIVKRSRILTEHFTH